MTEQQPSELLGLFQAMGQQIAGLSTTVGAQGVAKVVKPFGGESSNFKDWIKSIEKYGRLVGMDTASIKLIAYQSSAGAVSDFLRRYLDLHPDHDWDRIKTELQIRFGEVVDPQHAMLLLRKVKQKSGEGIQVYAERLISLGDDAFRGQPNDIKEFQLIGYFIDGLAQDPLKLKIMRDNPRTLQEAIDKATDEYNLRKRFSLRTGKPFASSNDSSQHPEPMDVDHFNKRPRCFKCGKKGHLAKVCRSVNSVERGLKQGVVCWNCNEVGHFARECRKTYVNREYSGPGPNRQTQRLNSQAPRM